VFVVHESSEVLTKAGLHGDYFGGYADDPPFSHAVLLSGRPELDAQTVRMITRHAGWIDGTQDSCVQNDPEPPDPWDDLSGHLEALCRQLSEQGVRAESFRHGHPLEFCNPNDLLCRSVSIQREAATVPETIHVLVLSGKATGRKQFIIAGVVTEVCVALPVLKWSCLTAPAGRSIVDYQSVKMGRLA
jgi:hypothetical protein